MKVRPMRIEICEDDELITNECGRGGCNSEAGRAYHAAAAAKIEALGHEWIRPQGVRASYGGWQEAARHGALKIGCVLTHDYAGPRGSRAVQLNPTVAAVLIEANRAGLEAGRAELARQRRADLAYADECEEGGDPEVAALFRARWG